MKSESPTTRLCKLGTARQRRKEPPGSLGFRDVSHLLTSSPLARAARATFVYSEWWSSNTNLTQADLLLQGDADLLAGQGSRHLNTFMCFWYVGRCRGDA